MRLGFEFGFGSGLGLDSPHEDLEPPPRLAAARAVLAAHPLWDGVRAAPRRISLDLDRAHDTVALAQRELRLRAVDLPRRLGLG